MTIFRIEADTDNYAVLGYQNITIRRTVPRFMGQSLKNTWGQWADLRVNMIVDEPAQRPESDFYAYLDWRRIAVTRYAWEILQPLVGDNVEPLPLACPSVDLLALNVLLVLDCLDLSNAEPQYSADEGRWYSGVRFKDGACRGIPVFKVPSYKHESYIYVSDEFKALVETNGLRGLRFIEMKED
jgi:hypothetical protein